MYEPDPDVIGAARLGDTAAFEELVRGYQSHVWRFLRHLLGDAALAEDVTQETFLAIYRKLDTFQYRSKFSTWVFRIARNSGIDAIRSRQRRDRIAGAVGASLPTDNVSTADLRLEIEEALTTLSPRLREAFVLVEALGLTYREAGQAIGIPEGTVKSRVHYARAELVAWMEEGMEEADNG